MSTDQPRSETQFSVFLVNKPGALARVCQHLADHKINIVAMSMMDAGEHGVLRFVCQSADRGRAALQGLDLHTAEAEVLLVALPNRPGAVADVLERLAADRNGVNYAYVTTGAPGGKTLVVLKVQNLKRAMSLLSERKPRRKPPATARRTAR